MAQRVKALAVNPEDTHMVLRENRMLQVSLHFLHSCAMYVAPHDNIYVIKFGLHLMQCNGIKSGYFLLSVQRYLLITAVQSLHKYLCN